MNNIKPIATIAAKAGIKKEDIELYGNYKCKINLKEVNPKGKLILVTAMNPTPLGEGKTTVLIGLADGLRKLGKNVFAALREPSLGPVFGVKGGAAGGGKSQVMPDIDINLHFTGDIHAVTSANNLLAAMVDNHIYQGNSLNINPDRIIWRRCMDMNDRNLRNITSGQGKETDGVELKSGFDISAASEIMAILCLSKNIEDLKSRLSDITVAYNMDGKPVYARELKAENAMTILLKDAMKPNLVQTLEGTPVFIHGGPFANIAHGCNSIIATKAALTYGDYCITEAGFGADLGAEKFFDVKCRVAGLNPCCVVLVATIKALKYNAGIAKENLKEENTQAIKIGFLNLKKHIENITKVFGLPCAVAINRFDTDTDAEIACLKELCKELDVSAAEMTAFRDGGEGALELAEEVLRLSERKSELKYAYELTDSIKTKITKVATKVYGSLGVNFSDKAKGEIENIIRAGYADLPVIIAKTQYSLSDNAALLNRPENFYLEVRDIILKSGAKFIVAVTGNIMLMPGLPKTPIAEQMFIDNDGNIHGVS